MVIVSGSAAYVPQRLHDAHPTARHGTSVVSPPWPGCCSMFFSAQTVSAIHATSPHCLYLSDLYIDICLYSYHFSDHSPWRLSKYHSNHNHTHLSPSLEDIIQRTSHFSVSSRRAQLLTVPKCFCSDEIILAISSNNSTNCLQKKM